MRWSSLVVFVVAILAFGCASPTETLPAPPTLPPTVAEPMGYQTETATSADDTHEVTGLSSPDASDQRTSSVVGPEQRQHLIEELLYWSGDIRIEAGCTGYACLERLSLGDDVALHLPDERFFQLGEASTNLASSIVAIEDVVMLPVVRRIAERDHAEIGIIVASTWDGGESFGVVEALGADCAKDIASLRPEERVMQILTGPGDVWFAVRGEDVIVLKGCSWEPSWRDLDFDTLSGYQEYLLDQSCATPCWGGCVGG